MLLIAQKDKEWKTSYHPCLPTTYYLLCPHTTAASVSDAPIAVNQDVNSSLARFSFSTCSLFIPSPWCSSLTFIAPVNEILFCCVYSPAVLSLARPRSPSPVYSPELLQVSLYSKVHVPPLLLEQHDLISWSYVNVFMVSYGLSYYMID